MKILAGVDEVGRGSLIGPVYAAAVILNKSINKRLIKDSKILTSHRSYLFSKNRFISYDFRLYVSKQREFNYYIDSIIKKKPTHLLYSSIDHDNNRDILKNCRGELVIRGKNVHQTNKRNPFGNVERKYDGYIYKIDLDKLKKCKINKWKKNYIFNLKPIFLIRL